MALQTATNPQTGESVALVGNQWVPITQTATNPKTGAKAYLVNNEWMVDEVAAKPTTPTTSAPAAQPQPYKSKTEALDDAVNLIEEGAPAELVRQRFEQAGIKWPEIIKHGQARGSDYFKTEAIPPGTAVSTTPSGEIKPSPEKGAVKATTDAFKRAGASLSDVATSYLFQTGAIDPDDAGRLLARNAKQRAAAAPEADIQEGMMKIADSKTFGEAATNLALNPRATFTMLVDSLLVSAPSMAAMAPFLGASAVTRGIATGLGSGGLEYGSVMADVLQDKGVDLLNAEQVGKALSDPKIIAEMKDRAAKRGLVVGAVDGLTAGLAGRFAQPARQLIAEGKLAGNAARKATVSAWAKELALQAGGGAGGEALAQKVAGEEFKPADILLEGIAETFTAPLEARGALREAKQLEAQRVPTVEPGAVPRVEPEIKTDVAPPERKERTLDAELTKEQQINALTQQLVQTRGMAEEDARKIATMRVNALAVEAQRRETEAEEERKAKLREGLVIPDDDPRVQAYAGELLDNNIVSTKAEAIALAKKRVADEEAADAAGAEDVIEPTVAGGGEGVSISGGPPGAEPPGGVAPSIDTGVAGAEPAAKPTVPREEPPPAELKTTRDTLYDQAKNLVIESQRASVSLIQRGLRVGYNRAQRILEQLEAEGVVSAKDANLVRSVLVEKPTPKEEAPSVTAPTETVEAEETRAATPVEGAEVAEPAAETPRAKAIKRLSELTEEARKLESDKLTGFANEIDPEVNKETIANYADEDLDELVKDIERQVTRQKRGAATFDLFPVLTGNGFITYVDNEETAAAYGKENKPPELEQVDFESLLIAPTMNQAKVKLGLPESAKMSTLMQTASDKGYDGITFKSSTGQQYLFFPYQRPFESASPSTALSGAPVNERLNKVNNAVQGLTVVAQTGDDLQKALANRFKSVATNVPVVVLEQNTPLPKQIADNPALKDSWDVANAMYVGPAYGQPTIYLRGASFGDQQSINNVDMLHESAHAALDKKLITAENMAETQGVIAGVSKDPLVQGYAELQETMMLAQQAYDEAVKDGTIDPEVLELGETLNVFDSPREFAAYGTSNPYFVKFLKSVKTPARYSSTGRDKTLFTKFVEAVRKILGLAPNQFNALADLFDITDRIASMQVRPAQEVIGLRGRQLKTAKERAQQQKPSLAAKKPASKTITATPSANVKRMAKMLGAKLYGTPDKIAEVSIKELFQNSFDAIKGGFEEGIQTTGNVKIKIDGANRSITVIDDGPGMPASVMGNQFLQIAGTVKKTKRASGGLGVAKMLFLFENKELEVLSLNNGDIARMVTSGDELKESFDDPSKSPKIEITSDPKVVKQYINSTFPEGHGTLIRVVIPETYLDESTGETKDISFNTWNLARSNSLEHSPLFENINVLLDQGWGYSTLPLGNAFPIDEYTVFSKVKFNWGEARIYISKDELPYAPFENTYILSNGIYQFGTAIKDKPGYDGKKIKRNFYIDVSPNENVKPEDPGYPFDLNRQRFSPVAQKDFDNIFNYITLTFAQAEYGKEVQSFGVVQYIEPDGKLSSPEELKPEIPPAPTGLTLIKPTDKVEVKDGVMSINNRQVPELSVDDLSKVKIDIDELKIPQDKIDSTRVMVHDNLAKKLSADELNASSISRTDVINYEKDDTGVIIGGTVPFTAVAREKFGARFDAYLKEVGDIFMQLREVLVISDPSYANLEKEAIGVSFDKEYLGVSIRVPFSGSFLNPASTDLEDKGTPAQIAVSMIGTMIHELAHFKVRNHGSDFAKEMQRDIMYLETMPGFDLADVKNSFAKFLAKNMDIYQFLNKEFRSGDLESVGKRFSDASNEQVGDGRITEPVEVAGGKGEGKQGVPGGAKQSPQGVESVGLPAGVSGEAAERRAARTQKEIDNAVDEAVEKYETSKRAEGLAKQASLIYKLRNGKNIFPALAAIWRGTNYRIRQGLVKPVTNDFLAEWAGKDIPRLLEVNKQLQQLSGMAQKLMGAAADLSRSINNAFSQDPTLRAKLDEITKVTTLAQVDPTAEIRSERINKMFESLGPEGKRIYNDVKQYYDDMAELYSSLLDDQINDANIPPEAKKKLLASIRKMYEGEGRLDPYFPLMRDGDFWLSVYVGNTKQFFMFPTMAERDAVAAQMAADRKDDLDNLLETKRFEIGNDLRKLRESSTRAINGQHPSAILKATFDLIDNADFTDITAREDMKDAVYQLYLRTMPEQSFRKQFIARKGYAGFRTDLLRDFNETSLRMSLQLARLKYAPKLRNTLSAARDSIQNRPELEPFVSQMETRVAQTLNPNIPGVLDKIASFVNKASFIYYLSGASSALLQPLGIVQTGIPILGARHGYGATAAEMTKLMKIWDQYGVMRKTATGSSVWSPPSIMNASGLTADERAAVESMLARDVTQNTYARALFDYKNVPTEEFGSVAQRGKYYANMVVGGLLHSTERLSREILFLASYRLSKRKNPNIPEEDAIDQAVQDTNDALGNYGEYNRPMIMRNAGGKIMLQFQMYPLHVTLYLMKNFKRMIPFLNKEGKAEAAKIFWGTMASTWMLAGAAGLPMFSAVMGLLGWAWGNADDDEKPKDVKDLSFELWFRTIFLPEVLGDYKINGKSLSEIVERGPMNALTGWDLSSRTQLNDLWFRDIKETKTPREELQAYAIEKAGPGVNMVLNLADSYEAFRNGDYQKGVEKMSPALIRNFILTHKYATEGAKDNKGAQILSKDAFTTGELVGQAIGFRSDLLANTQNVTFKLIGIQQRIENERQKLFDNIDREYRKQNFKAYNQLITKDLVEFNKKYPSFKIEADQLQDSLERRAKDRGESWRGLRLSEKNAALLAPAATVSRKAVAEREREAKKIPTEGRE
jgi:hypothetical protein